jgi:glycosyltransferase involved in cell wall biosynthesis
VLHLRTVTGRGGGPEKTLLTSPRFIGDGYDLRLAYIRPVDDKLYDMPMRAAKAGATLVDIPERHGLDPRTWRRLVDEIKQSRPAILHAHDYKTNVLAVLLGRRFGLPVMTTMHGYVSRGTRLNFYYRVDRWALRRMQRIVAVSSDLLEHALQLGIAPRKCVLVENAIDCDEFSRRQSVAEVKRRLGLPVDRLLVGAVGRLCEEKGFDRLILAMDQLLSNGIDAQLCILGEGGGRPELESLVARLGRQDRVRLLGYQSNTIDWYQAMDVFALSSLREGTPNVVLEAMAMEVPLVATRIAGVPKLIEDGVNGLLVEPDDVTGMTEALKNLLSDGALRERLARAGRQTVEGKYSFALRMQKIRALYDELLGRTPARGGEAQTDANQITSFQSESWATT